MSSVIGTRRCLISLLHLTDKGVGAGGTSRGRVIGGLEDGGAGGGGTSTGKSFTSGIDLLDDGSIKRRPLKLPVWPLMLSPLPLGPPLRVSVDPWL